MHPCKLHVPQTTSCMYPKQQAACNPNNKLHVPQATSCMYPKQQAACNPNNKHVFSVVGTDPLPCRFGAASYVPALALEKPLYIRERNDGLYRPITYLLAKLFDELFITVFASVVFSLAVWYLVQVRRLCQESPTHGYMHAPQFPHRIPSLRWQPLNCWPRSPVACCHLLCRRRVSITSGHIAERTLRQFPVSHSL